MVDQLIKLRSKERLLALGIAGLCIILGFLLFIFAPNASEAGTAQLEWMEKKMMLANVGPGVFFALFGAAITVYSIVTQATTSTEKNGENSVVTYRYLQKDVKDNQETENLRSNYQRDFRIFSEVMQKLEENESVPERLRMDFENALTNSKDFLMRSVWDESWGDYNQFSNWISMGFPEPPPPEISKAAKYFSGK
jgi:hypothetical protein